eukprot:TRINITY_DN6529_c0_g1_i10.p3 TRINITY_DN6529_c0_g1~~TRINITY_DN6529_c0_g1_i10.p3  ORF type:complete len:171 (-),score=28.76 TRINITY_DN6529_c0_g1_i10:366-878(-)
MPIHPQKMPSPQRLKQLQEQWPDFGCEGIKVQRALQPTSQCQGKKSTSPMSPVYNEEIEDAQKSVYSWVGIIMYLPTDDEETRNMISDKFGEYSRMLEMEIMPEFNATYHWAKIEVPMGGEELGYYQRMLARRYPLTRFNYLRVRLDPRNILSNRMINAGFSTPHGTWYM